MSQAIRTEETINKELKQHAAELNDWQYRDQVGRLHEWNERFNRVFDLGLQTPAIRIEPISARKFGTYHPGRNGFGLGHEITLNSRHLDRPLADQLRTLLHELIHQWQTLYGKSGKNNYHNRQFQQKAALYGVLVDNRGYNLGVEPGRFTTLLIEHGVDVSALDSPGSPGEPQRFTAPLVRGDSKQKKWACGCTNVRCAVELAARCERCGIRFREAAPAW
jgi:SprT-like family protein